MGVTLHNKDCKDTKTKVDCINLLDEKLNDVKKVYEESIAAYKKALTDREYEMLMRECDVIYEMDMLQGIIDTLIKKLADCGVDVKIKETEVPKKDGKVLIKKEVITSEKASVKPKSSVTKVKQEAVKKPNVTTNNVNANVKEVVKENVKKPNVAINVNVNVKEVVNTNVKKAVKEELKNSKEVPKVVKTDARIPNSKIILPSVVGITEEKRTELIQRVSELEKYILEAKNYKDGIAYPCRRLAFIQMHKDFLLTVMLLVENTPKARGSYAWTKVTNILKECEDYREIVGEFLAETSFKLTYLNIRNWYMSLRELIDDM